MLQICADAGSPYDRVFRVRVDGRTWAMASSGGGALLVLLDGDGRDWSGLAAFTGDPGYAFRGVPEPRRAVRWHDLQGWLRDRVAVKPCPDCGGCKHWCEFCQGEPCIPSEPADFCGVPIDRNLLAKLLAPVFAPRVLIAAAPTDFAGGFCAPLHIRAVDDSWRVYCAPVRHSEEACRRRWFPRGLLEAACAS
jgi:hypothetical protein